MLILKTLNLMIKSFVIEKLDFNSAFDLDFDFVIKTSLL